MSTALSLTRNYEPLECRNCGIEYWLPISFLAYRRESGEWWWCPNGHKWHFTETEIDKLKTQVAAAQRAFEWQRQLREKADKDRRKVERKLRRVEAGVCPHCNRSFENLRRHMETKHKADETPA